MLQEETELDRSEFPYQLPEWICGLIGIVFFGALAIGVVFGMIIVQQELLTLIGR